MKVATISALVTALILAGTATAAALVVTSKNIKNGTIQLVDLSSAAKAKLRGQRGAAGPQGPQGPQGLQGIQRLVAVEDVVNVEPETTATAVAYCPAGTVAVSGGFSTNADGSVFASSSVTVGWWVSISTAGGAFGGVLRSYAYCSPNITTSAGAGPSLRRMQRLVDELNDGRRLRG